MRTALMKAVVGTTAALGLAAGSLIGASAGLAAAQPAVSSAGGVQNVASPASALASNNLGLDTARAKNWQCWLRTLGFSPGAIDGDLGTNSWKAAQRMLNARNLGAGAVDGDPGYNTISALQRYLNWFGYGLQVDGDPGPLTRAAFWDFNATGC
ncbi:peptidoglycan-binding domain-containing protein [Streptomyces apricus]|uniref:Peptidoglycan-binding protein n=1 Tax=Streptomyces apricus TaxID=1828112 RepID=A0A5B0BHV0_9ACTN|nr:peptidoglycan-binding domain-containing protein [Streptomyces apricus]KAA0941774.1 peptidoglycan-binding protein [Streptomyces apricus]